MAPLRPLQTNLHQLGFYRRGVRIAAGLCAVGAVALGGLWGLFGLDLWLEMHVLERLIAEAGWLAAVGWSVWKVLWPALTTHEDESALAFMVEANHGMGSDLTAALQFNDASRSQHGSATLRAALVHHVHDLGRSLNVLRGLDTRLVQRNGALLGVLGLGWLSISLMYPAHVSAFANRLALIHGQYPTATRITKIISPGKAAAYGKSVRFAIEIEGQMPETARAEIDTADGSSTTTLTLKSMSDQPHVYAASLDKVYSDLRYRILAGDDRTRIRHLQLMAPANVELDYRVGLPDYARGRFEVKRHGQQLTVLAGSDVVPVLSSDKALRRAVLKIGKRTYPMSPHQSAKTGTATAPATTFQLPEEGSPLAPVERSRVFTIEVTDEDGLGLDQPLAGRIRLTPDKPPQVKAQRAARLVLAQATPRIRITAKDDFGLKRVSLRTVGTPGSHEPPGLEKILLNSQGSAERRTSFERTVKLPLAPLNLNKGDRLEVVIEARDARGDSPGQSTISEPIIFEITDRAGLIRALREQDAKLDRQLQSIIDAELQIGGAQ